MDLRFGDENIRHSSKMTLENERWKQKRREVGGRGGLQSTRFFIQKNEISRSGAEPTGSEISTERGRKKTEDRTYLGRRAVD